MPELYEGRSGRPRETTMGEKNDKPNSMDVQIEVLRIRSPSIVLSKFPGILQLYSHETPTYTSMFTSMCTFSLLMFINSCQLSPQFLTNKFTPPIVGHASYLKKTHPKNHPRSCMRQLLDFYNFATDHTASRPDFWSCFRRKRMVQNARGWEVMPAIMFQEISGAFFCDQILSEWFRLASLLLKL